MPKNSNLATLRSIRALEGNRYGHTARVLHLAYGLLRGRSLDRIESPNSNPYTFPGTQTILGYVKSYYRPFSDGEGLTLAEYEAEKAAFCKQIEADIQSWDRTLRMNWMQTEAKRRARNAARTPRVHTPRPAMLASRGA